jgi:hypothetical protein
MEKYNEKNPSNVYEKFHGIPWKIPWNSMYGIFHGNFHGNFHGIPWNSMENSMN